MRFNSQKLMLIMEIRIYNLRKMISVRLIFQVLYPLLFLFFYLFQQPQSLGQVESLAAKSPVGCIFHWLSGFLCPGCGMTRSMISFFSLQWDLSLYFNPLGLFLGMALGLLWFASFKHWHRAINSCSLVFNKWALASLIVVLSWGVLRNVPLV